ncbi:MAG: hypothetical protein ACI3ZO_01485 [Candidatus Cryptobacteroides sp.]
MKKTILLAAMAVMMLAGCKENETAFVLPSAGELVLYRTDNMAASGAASSADTLKALGINAVSIDFRYIADGDELKRAISELHKRGIALLGCADVDVASAMLGCAQAGLDGFVCGMSDSLSLDELGSAVSDARSATPSKLLMIADATSQELFSAGFDANISAEFTDSLSAVFCRDSSALKMVIADDEEYAGVPAGKASLRYVPDSVMNIGGGAALAASAADIVTRGGMIVRQGQKNNPALRRLLRINAAEPGLHSSSMSSYSDNEAYILEKISGEERYLLVLNVKDSTLAVPIPDSWRNVPFTNLVTGKKGRTGGRMPVTPYELRILKK